MSKDELQNKAGSVNHADSENKSRIFSWLRGLKKHWWTVGIIVLLSLGALGAGLKYLEQDAARQTAKRQSENGNPQEKSFLNSVNPFVTNPTPTPQLSKEYLYAGSKLLSVTDANADAAPPADLAVWRPDTTNGTGTWLVMGGTGSQQTNVQWGTNTDTTVPGDYDGDGKTDFSVFRSSTGYWYIQKSSDQAMLSYYFGASTDKVAPADYDGDGRTDVAVFRPSDGSWYIQRSSDGGLTAAQFGLGTDTPVPADFDGDGKADLAVWRGSTNSFYIQRSSDGAFQGITYGANGDTPVPADYDGDGRADAAVWRYGSWNILYSSTGASQTFTFGDPASDKAVQNDYDGDGKVDVAIWRPSNGRWYILQSSKVGQNDYQREEQWGQNGDTPVPAFYRR